MAETYGPSTEEIGKLRADLDTANRRLADMRTEFSALEMDFIELKEFFIQYLANERASLMSIAKFADSKLKREP
jgi:hypothetical protein